MSDSVDTHGARVEGGPPSETETLTEMAKVVLWDGVIGAVAGAGGSAVVLATVYVASLLGGFDPATFTVAAEIMGLEGALSGDQLLLAGLVLFVLGGIVPLPLLLVTLGAFLPGRRYATRGLVFGAIVWTGFVLAYNAGFAGFDLAVYVVLTFLGHLGYGYVTGWLLDRMFSEEGRPYVTAAIIAPTAYEDGAPGRDGGMIDERDEPGR